MMMIRPIQRKDQDLFDAFSFDSLLGMTNLPRNRENLLDKILHSEKYFSKSIQKPGEEEYFFVLEDSNTGIVGGICGILAQSIKSFRYYYKIETLTTHAHQISSPKEMKILKVVPNTADSSEICALFLHPTFRGCGQGRLLSLSRFLFIAAHPERFHKKIIAEMRGYIDENHNSPFWDGIGRHFCDLSFSELMSQIDRNHEFIPEILPQFPIYISLLSEQTQASIGKTHENTKPAHQMLINENFTYTHEVDIFEGGPILSAPIQKIRSIQNSTSVFIDMTSETLEEESEYLLANEKINFRSCIGRLRRVSSSTVLINKEIAEALQVRKGDKIRFVTTH